MITYIGALGGWYLTTEMAQFVAYARQRDRAVFGLFVTQSDPGMLRCELRRCGVGEADYRVIRAEAGEVPQLLAASDMALSLIKPCYSKLFSSPTKIAEYLAAGLPVVSTTPIGDVDALICSRKVGVLIRHLAEQEYQRAYDEASALIGDPGLAERCRLAAQEEFGLNTVGGPRYRRLYDRLA